eukprot:11038728-Karenia_brevis.AAC.1
MKPEVRRARAQQPVGATPPASCAAPKRDNSPSPQACPRYHQLSASRPPHGTAQPPPQDTALGSRQRTGRQRQQPPRPGGQADTPALEAVRGLLPTAGIQRTPQDVLQHAKVDVV